MKIAITAKENKGLNAKMDSRFGRAAYFALIDPEKEGVEFIDNPATGAASGAGVLAAQTVADSGITGLISGNYGPKAFDGLKAAGIKLYTFNGGTIQEAVEAYNEGKLEEVSDPTSRSHAGFKVV